MNANDEEGIVIKPRKTFMQGIPPAFKTRNNDYLTLIYGMDFQDRLEEQIAKCNIKGTSNGSFSLTRTSGMKKPSLKRCEMGT